MSIQTEVKTALRDALVELEQRGDDIDAAVLADAVYARYSADATSHVVQFLTRKQIRTMAGDVLRERLHPGERWQGAQGDMFGGRLQTHYPVPRSGGKYRIPARMDDDDLCAIAVRYRGLSDALAEHADTILAYVEARKNAPIAASQ